MLAFFQGVAPQCGVLLPGRGLQLALTRGGGSPSGAERGDEATQYTGLFSRGGSLQGSLSACAGSSRPRPTMCSASASKATASTATLEVGGNIATTGSSGEGCDIYPIGDGWTGLLSGVAPPAAARRGGSRLAFYRGVAPHSAGSRGEAPKGSLRAARFRSGQVGSAHRILRWQRSAALPS